MSSSSVAMNSDTPVTDHKVAAAKSLLEAWCVQFRRQVEDIPALAESKTDSRQVGVLVYCIRTFVDLDIMSTAELLGLHAGTMVIMMTRARQRLSEQYVTDKEHVDALLEATGIKRRRSKAGLRGVAEKPGAARIRVDCVAQKRGARLLLEQEGEACIAKILIGFPSVTREDLFLKLRRNSVSHARTITFAILYHVVLSKKGQGAVAAFSGMNVNTVQHGLSLVNQALCSERNTLLKGKILSTCARLEIPPEQLKLVPRAMK